jgi:acetyltransferase-like isoleucine patch superfamily enzyme
MIRDFTLAWLLRAIKRALTFVGKATYNINNKIEILGDRKRLFLTMSGIDNIIKTATSARFVHFEIKIIANGSEFLVGEDTELCGKVELFGENSRILIGDGSYLGRVFLLASSGRSIEIGADCLFSDGVDIRTTDSHEIFDESGGYLNPDADVSIGERVWLGRDVTITKGVTIGNDVVVGAKSVVTHDLPNNCVAVGVPARIIRSGTSWKR